MNEKEINAYKDGFLAGIDLKNGNFIKTLFGLPVGEVIEILVRHTLEKYKESVIVIDHVDKAPVIIKRNGKEVYRDNC